jgi:putative lysine transport system substrate-binding protein
VDEGDVNIGVSIAKGNSQLVSACNSVLANYTADDFTKLMNTAISVQPLSN